MWHVISYIENTVYDTINISPAAERVLKEVERAAAEVGIVLSDDDDDDD